LGDLTASEALGEESMAIARELGDHWVLADALATRGLVCVVWPRPGTDDLARGRTYLEEAQTLYEGAGSQDGIARSRVASIQVWRGVALLVAGDLRDAETQLARSLALTQATGDRYYAGLALLHLGRLAWVRGDPAGAHARFEQALTHQEALRNHYNISYVLMSLGDLQWQIGDPSGGRAYYARALRTLHALGHAEPSHLALCGLAGLAIDAGEPVYALRLVSVSHTLSTVNGVLASPQGRITIDQVEAAARQALSPETQAAAWAAGQAMSMEQVIAEALAPGRPEQT
jgi:tetratricopeptide (TPR) repeat protein